MLNFCLKYSGHYKSFNKLAQFYNQSNQIKEAIAFMEGSFEIRELLYVENPDSWKKEYIQFLEYLAMFYSKDKQDLKAIELEQESLKILKTCYSKDPTTWVNKYTTSLKHLIILYKNNNQFSEAIVLEEESCQILKKFYAKDPTLWAEKYDLALYNLSLSYIELEDLVKAYECYKEDIEVLRFLYSQDKEKWIKNYLLTLENIAKHFIRVESYEKACLYLEEYFLVVDLDYMTECYEISDYIYSFILYYQLLQLNSKDIKTLENGVSKTITYFKAKFFSCYEEQIKKEEDIYLVLKESEDKLEREKYKIFIKLFSI